MHIPLSPFPPLTSFYALGKISVLVTPYLVLVTHAVKEATEKRMTWSHLKFVTTELKLDR